MNLVTIGNMQAGWATNWFLFHDPFTFCIFWIFFTCATASVNRAPFDLAEAESELVAGFHTEYSGLRWSFFFMAEYGSMFLVSGIGAILFFGGWNGPIPIMHVIGWADSGGLTGYLANLAGCVNFMIKATVGVTVMMWVRWTLPRLRIDQVITTCLKYCVPLASVCFLGAVGWEAFDIPSPNHLHLGVDVPAHAVREQWVTEPRFPGGSSTVIPQSSEVDQHEQTTDMPGDPQKAAGVTSSDQPPARARMLLTAAGGQEVTP